MNKLLSFMYLIFGFIAGYAVALHTESTPQLLLSRLGFALAAIVVIGLLQWFESTSHKRHLKHWKRHLQQGKFKFVFFYYIMGRGLTILLFFTAPFFHIKNFSSESLIILGVTALVVFLVTFFFGVTEWNHYEQDISAQALRQRGEEIKQQTKDFSEN